jgi:hypothetical protein
MYSKNIRRYLETEVFLSVSSLRISNKVIPAKVGTWIVITSIIL